MSPSRPREPIAIVGMACLFPGADSPGAFFRNVLAKRDAAREVPRGRWTLEPGKIKAREPGEADRVASIRGCFLDETWAGETPAPTGVEALEGLDPLAKIVLHAGRAAWQSARTEHVDRERAGIVLANIALPTEGSSRLARSVLFEARESKLLGRHAEHARVSDPLNRYVTGFPAGLLARALGLGGGSYTLDAACASSLFALKLASDELLAGRADAM